MKLKSINNIVAFSLLPIFLSSGSREELLIYDENEFYLMKDTTIPAYFDYSVKRSSFVKLSVKNLTGSEVYGFVPGDMEDGNYHMIWNLSKDDKLLAGVFELEVYENGTQTSKKIIYIPEEFSEVDSEEYHDSAVSYEDEELED